MKPKYTPCQAHSFDEEKTTPTLEQTLINIMRDATLNTGESSYILEAKAVAKFIREAYGAC